MVDMSSSKEPSTSKELTVIVTDYCPYCKDLITEQSGRGGPIGWLQSGREAIKKTTPPINAIKEGPSGYDLVVVGTPIWAWRLVSPVRSYLVQVKGKLRRVAFFCTCGSNSGSAFEAMQNLAGIDPAAKMEVNYPPLKDVGL